MKNRSHFGNSDDAVVVDGVTYAYGDRPVLDSVSFRVPTGQLVALAGPNGSGKSTLLRLILGVLRLQGGTVHLLGSPPGRLHHPWRVGYVPQRPTPATMQATVEEVVAAGRVARRGLFGRLRSEDRDEIDHALVSVELSDLRTRPLGELSGGQQQRAFIAKALASKPELLVLDEPVAGVDADAQDRFRDAVVHLIRDHAGTVLLVSHELGAVANDLDRVLLLQKGHISFDGHPDELVARGVNLGVHREDLPVWLEGEV